MKTRMRMIGLGAAAALATGVGIYAFSAASAESGPPFTQHMGPGNAHGGASAAGSWMAHNTATMAQMSVIHELFVNHDKITRTVTNLPDGIRTVTESDDARIAELLKGHVADMGQRVEAGDDPGLPIESEALRSIFRDYASIETKIGTTERGVVVIQTSTDPETVAALQQHASEVTDFVQQGMVALQTAMMKSVGGGTTHAGMGAMGGMMMGGMGHGGPPTPDGQ